MGGYTPTLLPSETYINTLSPQKNEGKTKIIAQVKEEQPSQRSEIEKANPQSQVTSDL